MPVSALSVSVYGWLLVRERREKERKREKRERKRGREEVREKVRVRTKQLLLLFNFVFHRFSMKFFPSFFDREGNRFLSFQLVGFL